MADELGAELSLDLDAARREIESFRRDVEDELDKAVKTFADSYEDTIGRLPAIEPEIESQLITEELNRAVAASDEVLAVETDTGAVTSSINEAVGAADAVVDVDTGPMVAEITDAVASADLTIEPEIDTAAARASLEDLANAFDSGEIEGTALSGADFRAQELADSLSDLATEGERTKDTLGAVSNVSTTTATAFSAARGDGSKLFTLLGEMDPSMKALAGTTLGVAAGFTALFQAGQANVASLERSNQVLGENARLIENINVGGLVGDLGDLAARAGSSDNALRNAASSASQMGLASGKSATEVTDFANKVNALALRAVAMNPALGDAGNVAERLNQVLARGGRFLSRYGLDLTAAEITLRALADTGKTSVADLTLFERSVAGADIAVEKLGDRLGRDFDKGAEQATLRLRALHTEIGDAFAAAGEPLVKPTIDALESLAGAATGVSKALGEIGQVALPPVARGLESLGAAGTTASDALGLIPSEVLAIAAGLLVLDRATGRSIRSFGDLRAGAALAMDTIAGRSVAALGALTALDIGLEVLGTSTRELGVEFVTTGAAIGFALGGPTGAVGGALIGGIVQAVQAVGSLEQATKAVDEEFQAAEQSSGDLRSALFANADTAAGLASALAGLDDNLTEFILNASAFKALGLDKELRAIGITAVEVGDLAQKGDAGLAKFIDRLQQTGKVSVDVAKLVASSIQIETGGTRNLDEDLSERVSNAIEAGRGFSNIAIEVKDRLKELGVGARLTGEEYAALTNAQQRNILALLRERGESTKLIAAFSTLQDQLRGTERAQFEMFATTNKLSPAIVRAAKHVDLAEDDTRDWTRALAILGDAAIGLLPEFGRLTKETALVQREFTLATAAIENAAAAIPTLGQALSKGLDVAFSENLKIPNPLAEFDENAPDTIFVGPVLDTTKLLDSLNQTTVDVRSFFDHIRVIADSGATNTAAALLQLGPDNLGARMAADLAANQEPFREGMETAFEGIAQAQLVGETMIQTMSERITFLALALGSPLEDTLKQAFDVTDISVLSTEQIAGFVKQFPELGGVAGEEFVTALNREIVARRISGIDTTEMEASITGAQARLLDATTALMTDLDVAQQAAIKQFFINGELSAEELAKGLESKDPRVKAAAEATAALVEGGMFGLPGKADEYGRLTSEELAKGIESENPKVRAAALAYQALVESGMFGLPGAAETIGMQTQDGFIRGLGMKQSEVEAYIRTLSAADAAAFGAALQVTSPSKITTYFGEMLGEGLIVGMKKTENEVMAASGALANAALPGRWGGFGSTPAPPAGMAPFAVQVKLDPSMFGTSVDSSIHMGDVHNYGPDVDSRGRGLVRALRDYQFMG